MDKVKLIYNFLEFLNVGKLKVLLVLLLEGYMDLLLKLYFLNIF